MNIIQHNFVQTLSQQHLLIQCTNLCRARIRINDCSKAGIKLFGVESILLFDLCIDVRNSILGEVRKKLINTLLCRLETIQNNLLLSCQTVNLDIFNARSIKVFEDSVEGLYSLLSINTSLNLLLASQVGRSCNNIIRQSVIVKHEPNSKLDVASGHILELARPNKSHLLLSCLLNTRNSVQIGIQWHQLFLFERIFARSQSCHRFRHNYETSTECSQCSMKEGPSACWRIFQRSTTWNRRRR
mmetsp:Transcript_21135/g.46084  ORF Transcript_21135/g.46084 Transcript_21135/m.46084 type:complete len:243 (-) Transcript_21135:184-912(-)